MIKHEGNSDCHNIMLWSFVLFSCLTLNGCLATLSSPVKKVGVSSSPVGANVEIRNIYGDVVRAGRTPFIVNLEKKNNYTLNFRYNEKSASASISSHKTPLYLVNLLLYPLFTSVIYNSLSDRDRTDDNRNFLSAMGVACAGFSIAIDYNANQSYCLDRGKIHVNLLDENSKNETVKHAEKNALKD